MSIKDLTQKILSDAQKQIDNIIAENKTKIDVIEKNTKELVATLTRELRADTEKIQSENEKRIISKANQEAKIEIDSKKRKVLDGVFKSVYKQLINLDDTKYETLITKLLRSLPLNAVTTILVPANRIEITGRALQTVGLSILMTEDSSMEGGFILKGKDFEYNFTFSKILENKKNELEIEISKTLFRPVPI